MSILSIFLSSYVLAVSNSDIQQGRPQRVVDPAIRLEGTGANLNIFPVFHVFSSLEGTKVCSQTGWGGMAGLPTLDPPLVIRANHCFQR